MVYYLKSFSFMIYKLELQEEIKTWQVPKTEEGHFFTLNINTRYFYVIFKYEVSFLLKKMIML